jgi:hypothetical protein
VNVVRTEVIFSVKCASSQNARNFGLKNYKGRVDASGLYWIDQTRICLENLEIFLILLTFMSLI